MTSGELNERVMGRLQAMADVHFAERLGNKDGTLWSDDQEVINFIESFLGWVDVPVRTLAQVDQVVEFASSVKSAGFTDAVVLGMGGSSLSALMLAMAFPDADGLNLHVLDSTVPADVKRIEDAVELSSTLFVVASKSGTTVEPLAMEEYFFSLLQAAMGERAADHMVAITDPGSQMEARARERGYRKVFMGEPEVGGRFSVFSVFGMVPAALAGLDVRGMLTRVSEMVPASPEGLNLGAALGEAAVAGVDKVTMVTSERWGGFGLWAEQLVAESTGKGGKGVLPLALEPVGNSEVYGKDRLFYVVGDPAEVGGMVSGLGFGDDRVVMSRAVQDEGDLAAMLYDWEIATAVAGAVLEVNPFDQPNVQQAKDIAKKRLAAIQESGEVSMGEPTASQDGVRLFGGSSSEFAEGISQFLNQAGEGDHVALLAFLPETEATTSTLQGMRVAVRDRLRVATSLGYGPRYLHSTGQYHKGGPDNGLYLVLTATDLVDMEIPGMGATFGQLKTAQALGDIGALEENGRKVLHVDLGDDVAAGLATLCSALSLG